MARGGGGEGGRAGRRSGGRLEFRDHRAYVPGDDPRDLDWSLFLRLDVLAVKQYARDEAPEIWVMLDRSASMGREGSGKDRIAREVAAGLGWCAMSSGAPVSVAILAEGGPVVLGRYRSRTRLEALLALLEGLGEASGPTTLDRLIHLPPAPAGGRVVYLLSDFLQEPLPAAGLVALARGSGTGTLLHVVSVEERRFDPREPGILVDPESGEQLRITDPEGFRGAYRMELERHEEAVSRCASSHGLLHLPVSDDREFEEAVLMALGVRR